MKIKILFFFLFIVNISKSQCLIVPIDINTLIQKSDVVVEGKLKFLNCIEENKKFYSIYQIEVHTIFKGTTQYMINLKSLGGQIGLKQLRVQPSDDLQEKIGIFCLKQNGNDFELTATAQGKIWIDGNNAIDIFERYTNAQKLRDNITQITHQKITVKSIPNVSHSSKRATPSITSLSPTSISAGTDSILTITGTNFNASQGTGYVEFRNANDGGSSYIQPLATDYISWSNTQIEVKVPTQAGSGTIRVVNSDPASVTSSSILTVRYNILNVTYLGIHYVAPLQGLNSGSSIPFAFNTRFNDSMKAKRDFVTAMEKWRCSTLVNFDTLSTTTTNDITAYDLENVVAWDFNNTLSLGTLGVAYSYYVGCAGGGFIYWHLDDLDILFNDLPYTGFTWEYGSGTPSSSQFDFESVALHEIGHGHQLGHVIDGTKTMHYSLTNGQRKNTISTQDSFGGKYILGLSTSIICINPAMTLLTSTNCSYVVLPVDLIELKTIGFNQYNLLNWKVLNERNIKSYHIEKSIDGNYFTEIGKISINNIYKYKTDYTFEDPITNNTECYYRIKCIDENGYIQYSNISSIFPNSLVSQMFYVASTNFQKHTVTSITDFDKIKNLKIFNILGKEIPFTTNQQAIEIETNTGIYIISYTYRNKEHLQKIILSN